MNKRAPVWKTFYFVKRKQQKKKNHLRKMALQLMVDKTIAFYLLVLGVYVFLSLFVFGETITQYSDEFLYFKNLAEDRFWLIVTALPIVYIMQSFKNPGVLFSSAELKLTMLTFTKGQIWTMTALQKWLKQFFAFIIGGLVIVSITPLSAPFIYTYLGMLWLIGMLMTIPQWRLFQLSIYKKLAMLVLAFVINGISVWLNVPVISGIAAISVLIILNLFLIRNIFRDVHWGRVVEINDFHLWSMPLVAKASNVKFQKSKKYSVFQNTKRRKIPFRYAYEPVHFRLWQVYFFKKTELVLQVAGSLLLLLIVLQFFQPIVMLIGIVIAIYVWTSMAATFFIDRFRVDILQILPWDLEKYKHSYIKWVYVGVIPIFLPLLSFFIMNFSFVIGIQFIMIVLAFHIILKMKLVQAISILSKGSDLFYKEGFSQVGLLAMVILSEFQPIVVAIAIPFIVWGMKKWGYV